MNKGFMIFSIVTGAITTVATVATAVDQIKNGDKRAAITGDAAGRAVVDECQKRRIGIFGCQIEEENS